MTPTPPSRPQPRTVELLPVGQVIGESIDALLLAAALHLGEATPDGRRLARPSGDEAWRALLAASAMIHAVGPMMEPMVASRYAAALQANLELLKRRFPQREFTVPAIFDR